VQRLRASLSAAAARGVARLGVWRRLAWWAPARLPGTRLRRGDVDVYYGTRKGQIAGEMDQLVRSRAAVPAALATPSTSTSTVRPQVARVDPRGHALLQRFQPHAGGGVFLHAARRRASPSQRPCRGAANTRQCTTSKRNSPACATCCRTRWQSRPGTDDVSVDSPISGMRCGAAPISSRSAPPRSPASFAAGHHRLPIGWGD